MSFVDLTVPLGEQTPVYPGDAPAQVERAGVFEEDGFNDHVLKLGTHIGTHIDAPYHMIADGKKLNEFPVSKFVGRGVCIDVRSGFSLESIESAALQEGDIVLLMTELSKKYYESTYFEDYPAIPKVFAEALIAKNIKMVGLDMCSPDHEPFEIHKLLLGSDVLIIENLTNLDAVFGKEFTVYALPLNVAMDGSPARVIAQLK